MGKIMPALNKGGLEKKHVQRNLVSCSLGYNSQKQDIYKTLNISKVAFTQYSVSH